VIPRGFDYTSPESLDDAVKALAEGGDDAKLLAGGHSLIPMLKLRVAAPSLLVDLRRVSGLHGVQRENGSTRIGSMTRHADLQADSSLGLVARAASTIADQQVRNRGTIGGSLAHGDPASDLPAVVLAFEGSVTAQGPDGQRSIDAADLFSSYMTTSLAADEVLTEIRLEDVDGWGHGFQKFNRRREDWAMVGVCALVKKAGDGSCEDVRVGLTHMGATPLRATAVEEALRGSALDADSISSAAEQAAEGTSPIGDLNASPDYKKHLARVLTARALTEAAA